jgi:hypothetical protein
MEREEAVTTLTLVHDEPCRLHSRGPHDDQGDLLTQLAYENACLKQAVQELMMEKLLLKVSCETKYKPGPSDLVEMLSHEAAGDALQRARDASAFVRPGVVGFHLRSVFGEVAKLPMRQETAELVRRLDQQRSKASMLSFFKL